MAPANEDPPVAPEQEPELDQDEAAAMDTEEAAAAMDTTGAGAGDGEEPPREGQDDTNPPPAEGKEEGGGGGGGGGGGVGVEEAKGGRRTPAATANGHAAMDVDNGGEAEAQGKEPGAGADGSSSSSSSNPEKHAAAAAEESRGEIAFRLVQNDGRSENSERLVALKNIFAKQLPKMPKEYIVRLVFDRRHRAIALCRGDLVVGGICYRPYPEQKFSEIAFCAITATEQVKGYGTRLMNHVKEQAKSEGILYFLTYADNYAIGYFRKQGFSKNLAMPKTQWSGFIKDYDGAHLMECYIHPTLNYLDVPAMLARQRAFLHERIKTRAKSHVVYPGLACFKDGKGKRVKDIMAVPGVREAGWNLAQLGPVSQRDLDRERAALQTFLEKTVRDVTAHKASWPFLDPVNTEEVADYLEVITDPIDLSLVESRVKEGDYYRSREMLLADLLRMCRNCKVYNSPNTEYYSAGQELESYIRGLFKKNEGAVPGAASSAAASSSSGGAKASE